MASTLPGQRVQLGPNLAGGARLLLSRPWPMIALGAGVVLALLSVCCGIGVVMAPWLLCELLALQLAQALARPVPHTRAWISAGLILLCAVLLTASVGWLTWLGLGTDAELAVAVQLQGVARVGSAGALLASASALVALLFVLPFLYAPLILIDARVGLGEAVLESARLVAAGGVFAHAALSFTVNALQALPLVGAGLGSALFGQDENAALLLLFSLPLLSLTVPLGQGVLVSAYAERRHDVATTARRAAEAAGFRAPRRLFALWTVLVIAPLLSFALLGASLVRPSRIAEGALPEQGEPIAELRALSGEQRVHPPGTALEIAVSARGLQVSASDGGGAGALPLRSAAEIEQLRVVRVRERYGLEVTQGGRRYVTWIDRAGVRQDDDLRARLLDRVPSWALLAMLAALLATGSLLLPVLASLAELRRLYADGSAARDPEMAERRRRRTLVGAYAGAGVLVPWAGLALYWGGRALW